MLATRKIFTYKTIFDSLKSSPNLKTIKKLHAVLILHGYLHQNFSPVLNSQLVNAYITLNSLQDAVFMFAYLPTKNSFAWNSILKGFVNSGQFCNAISIYHDMLKDGILSDNFTYPLVLRACSGSKDLEQGQNVHKRIDFDKHHHGFRPNLYTQCALIDMYSKCGSLSGAREVFDNMLVRDSVSWGAIICGTLQSGNYTEVMTLFKIMISKESVIDSVHLASVISASGRLGDLPLGMCLHCCTLKNGFIDDVCVSNALLDMYSKCGCTRIANFIFRCMKFRDVISWSSLIGGYSQNFEYHRSFAVFYEMIGNGVEPSSNTLASVLPSFSNWKLIKQGKEIHGYAIKHKLNLDIYVTSALVDFYSTCKLIKQAEFIFNITPCRDVVLANSMITGYAHDMNVVSALQVLRNFSKLGLKPNAVTIISILPLFNQFTMLNIGKEVHAYALRSALVSEVSVNNSLIDMYCKCGYLQHGKDIFDSMVSRDIVTYNTIITAFGMHGIVDKAISFFEIMRKEGIEPDRVTFIALLSACSHSGCEEKGIYFYNYMRNECGIVPDKEHYSCMVDMHGRAGKLNEAWDFITKMPVEAEIDVLGSLLAACRVHGRIDIAENVWKRIRETSDSGYHALMSNIYADVGRWENVKEVRRFVKEKGLKKKPGSSLIRIGDRVHLFMVKDRSHQEFDTICEVLVLVTFDMKDVEDEFDISCFL